MDNVEHSNPYNNVGHKLEQDIYFLNGEWNVRICEGGLELFSHKSVSKNIVENEAKTYISNIQPTEEHINKIKKEQYEKELNKGYNIPNNKSNRFGGV